MAGIIDLLGEILVFFLSMALVAKEKLYQLVEDLGRVCRRRNLRMNENDTLYVRHIKALTEYPALPGKT